MARRPKQPVDLGDDLFSIDEASNIEFAVNADGAGPGTVPVNLARRHVRDLVEALIPPLLATNCRQGYCGPCRTN
jgi:hypothetical protein